MRPYRIILTQADGIDVATAEWDERTFAHASTEGTIGPIARQLVQAGAPDGEWEVCNPVGRLQMYGRSLHLLAKGCMNAPKELVAEG
jgi:hypothetical protein